MEKKRVLILSASVGSGHIRAAQALEEACNKNPLIEEVLHIDALEYTSFFLRNLYSKGYLKAVQYVPDLWAWGFENTDEPWKKSQFGIDIQKAQSQPLVKKILTYNPDFIICTHFTPADIVSRLIMLDKLHANLGIVVTDFYVHALWLTDIFTRYFVPKMENKIHLNKYGIPLDRIEVTGIPVMQSFIPPEDTSDLFKKYNFDPAIPIVLLSAGMFGIMPAKDILRILENIQTHCHIVIICGKSESLRKQLLALIEEVKPRNQYTIVGFTNTMHDYLHMAKVFIGKPGGLATSEALCAGVPMIIWNPIPGQETYNAYHILENGAGLLPDNALTIGYKVDMILQDEVLYEQLKKNALSIAQPKAAETIIEIMLLNNNESPVKAFKKKQ
ncbi:MAG TPA: glycosyltransferase [Spirochaetia bacterium]|nr:glycosyltransferase [Spirochaetales bacterium]HRS65746.1 glycosyltransferase [Spirochaetia bacterium]HPD79870.1 glycosyltransferase [Spirochaetales bacterium]HQG39654.1 glycosyltransferase [Spirochaetales bacterium]HQK33275.1 glycosyltransferase [Spirochaetales bacterium]